MYTVNYLNICCYMVVPSTIIIKRTLILFVMAFSTLDSPIQLLKQRTDAIFEVVFQIYLIVNAYIYKCIYMNPKPVWAII